MLVTSLALRLYNFENFRKFLVFWIVLKSFCSSKRKFEMSLFSRYLLFSMFLSQKSIAKGDTASEDCMNQVISRNLKQLQCSTFKECCTVACGLNADSGFNHEKHSCRFEKNVFYEPETFCACDSGDRFIGNVTLIWSLVLVSLYLLQCIYFWDYAMGFICIDTVILL
jgi:hypothetical protein